MFKPKLVRVCEEKDFVNDRYLATVNGKPVAVFRLEGKYYAVSNVCAHMNGPLIGGTFNDQGKIVCPWHAYAYDVKTGKGPGTPGEEEQLDQYSVQLKGKELWVSEKPLKTATQQREELGFGFEKPKKGTVNSEWNCIICFQSYTGDLPPKQCGKCFAPWELIKPKDWVEQKVPEATRKKPTFAMEERRVAAYLELGLRKGEFSMPRIQMWRSIAQQEPLDVLLISASGQHQHIVSGWVAPKILERIQSMKPQLKTEWLNLTKLNIQHNWSCYSLDDDFCRFPCNIQNDDMKSVYPKLVRARSLCIATSINWEGQNSHLKVFLDRLTNLQDIPLKVNGADWAGRPVGLFVNGHEDGAYKTAWDVFAVLQNLGYILPPFGIWYNLSSLTANTNEDLEKVRNSQIAQQRLNKVVDNVLGMLELRLEKQLQAEPEGEKLRKVNYVAM